jgi:guanyl-specific ribonuclease Sa
MTILKRDQVVLDTMYTSNTSETVSVTWTATMKQGSLLVAANTEVANAAAAANAVKVIDDNTAILRAPAVGDTVLLNVAVRGNVFPLNAVLVYEDGDAAVSSALTGLAATVNIFK